ncbi:ATPase family AAA domain-containing protein 1-A, partial [Cucurbita argyrosperma subsp. sororia]
MGVSSETRFLQELVLYAASAALSCLVLFAGLRHLDPNREASKKALEHKKEIAKRLGRPLIQTNPYEDVIACDVINPDHIVAAVFSLAYKLQPSIIFIDEVDSFLSQRRSSDHEALSNMKTEFMALWDGFTTDQNARVMVLAATNRPSELDEAILRRLPQAFEIGVPNKRERAEILNVILKGERVEDIIDYDHIASLCEGYTGSDLLELCKKAAYFPIRDLLDEEKIGKQSNSPRPLSQSDMESALISSRKTKVVASEYAGLGSLRTESSDPRIQAVLSELSKFGISLPNVGSEDDDP